MTPPVPTEVFAAYLERLRLAAKPRADLAALTDLMARHLQIVPFENLDVLTRSLKTLSTEGVLEKVVRRARGGFCYELNEAFRALLEYLGFSVRRIEGRVWQSTAQRFGAPFDHLALVVTLPEAEFLVDVGYGDGNRTPLKLPEDESRDVSGGYRLSPVRDGFWCLRSESAPLYEFTLAAQSLDAFAPMYEYHGTSPNSIFSKGLLCTRATATGRLTLSRDRFTVTDGALRTETFPTDISAVLAQHFAIVAS